MLFRAPELAPLEIEVVQEIERLTAALAYMFSHHHRWYGLLRRNTEARAVRGSNAIEGLHVTIEDAVAAVEGEEPIDPKAEAWLAVSGYRAAMTFVLQKSQDPFFRFSAETLKALQFMMTGFDLSKNPGRWRPGAIFVRDETTGEQVYEGPPIEAVPALTDELLDQLNTEKRLPCVVEAAMAHLNLVMIHPFSDGNGRMGRCLQTLVMARSGIVAPPFSSIEEYLGRNTRPYYDVLAEVGQGAWHPERDARPWVRFCLTAHFRQAMTLHRRTRQMEKMCDELEVIAQREGLPGRCVLPLADAAVGMKIRNPSYRHAADVTDTVAGRDLKALTEAGLLVAMGEKRGRFYIASPTIIGVREKFAEPKAVADPFVDPSVFRKPGENLLLPGMDGLVS